MTLARSIPIRSNRFGIEPELTIKFAKRQASIYEVPISYYGRTYDEGKKIGAMDAVSALWVILRGYFTRDIYLDRGREHSGFAGGHEAIQQVDGGHGAARTWGRAFWSWAPGSAI